jgi:hypothetical protein
MRGSVIVCAAAALLAACGSSKSDDVDKRTYTIDQSNGTTKLTIKDEKGSTLAIDTQDSTSAGFPEGYSPYPGAKVVSNSTVAEGQGNATMILMETSAAPDKVATFYRNEARAAGVKIALDEQAGGGRVLSGQTAGGQAFTLQANPEKSGTSISLLVGQKPTP